MTAFVLTTGAGAVVDLQTWGAVEPGERRRAFAARPFRAVESQAWGVAGDRRELPGTLVLRLTLATTFETRAAQRQMIESLRGLLADVTQVTSVLDAITEPVDGGDITAEIPTFDPQGWVLELTFYPLAGAVMQATWIADDGDY